MSAGRKIPETGEDKNAAEQALSSDERQIGKAKGEENGAVRQEVPALKIENVRSVWGWRLKCFTVENQLCFRLPLKTNYRNSA